jgi:Lrp/AsnC family leucine-responsive transcriptional regulator
MAGNAGELDDVDWAVVHQLQQEARVSLSELGRRVGLSASATTERVRQLEASGVITGYHAVVDLTRVGYPVLAVVRLKYPGNRHQPLHRLLADRREILECLRTTGDDCYTLKVAATSMAHLETLIDELAALGSTSTSVVYRQTLPFRGPDRPAAPVPAARPGPPQAPGRAPGQAPGLHHPIGPR